MASSLDWWILWTSHVIKATSSRHTCFHDVRFWGSTLMSKVERTATTVRPVKSADICDRARAGIGRRRSHSARGSRRDGDDKVVAGTLVCAI